MNCMLKSRDRKTLCAAESDEHEIWSFNNIAVHVQLVFLP